MTISLATRAILLTLVFVPLSIVFALNAGTDAPLMTVLVAPVILLLLGGTLTLLSFRRGERPRWRSWLAVLLTFGPAAGLLGAYLFKQYETWQYERRWHVPAAVAHAQERPMTSSLNTAANRELLATLLVALSPDLDERTREQRLAVEAALASGEFDSPLAAFGRATDWQLTYNVDWKDSESLVECLQQLSRMWMVTLTFGVDDALNEAFLDSHDVPELLALADQELSAHNLGLWGWDTGSDSYAGWIGRVTDADFFAEVEITTGTDVRRGGNF